MWWFVLQMLGMVVGVILMVGMWLLSQVLAPYDARGLSGMLTGIVHGDPESLVFCSGLGVTLISFGFFVRDVIIGYRGK